MKKITLEEIHWDDHSSCRDMAWLRFDDLDREHFHCLTVGYVVEETKEAIHVCPTISPGSDTQYTKYAGHWTILKATVTKRRKISVIEVSD